MNEIQAVILIGMPGSGKSSCVEHIKKKGFPSVYFGDVTFDEMKRRGLAINQDNEKFIREEIRAKEGKDAYAKKIIEKMKQLANNGQTKIIVESLYSWPEYKIFKEHFGENAVMIAVAAPRAERHKRLASRPVRPLTEDEANKRDYAEIENIEKGGPIANADYTIVNEGPIDEMFKKLDEILQKVGFTK